MTLTKRTMAESLERRIVGAITICPQCKELAQ
jgi:hypothetical protein